MRQALFLTSFLLASCSPGSGETDDLTVPANSDRDHLMIIQNMNIPRHLKKFNDLFLAIRQENNASVLEQHFDQTFEWKSALLQSASDESESQLISGFYFILSDEIKRKKEQLRNKPGRQAAVDWFKSLKNHSNRIKAELDILTVILPGLAGQKIDVQELTDSLKLSTELLSVDLGQIDKRQAAGDFTLNKNQLMQVESAQQAINRAKDLQDSAD